MSIYVDDVFFSSKKEISQAFIDKLFGIIKGNDMQIKRQKVHSYKKESVKKVIRVFINGDKSSSIFSIVFIGLDVIIIIVGIIILFKKEENVA